MNDSRGKKKKKTQRGSLAKTVDARMNRNQIGNSHIRSLRDFFFFLEFKYTSREKDTIKRSIKYE